MSACGWGLGRVGSLGGGSWDSRLLGGLLNGEGSCEISPLPTACCPCESGVAIGFDAGIRGFSLLRGAGGGGAVFVVSRSRLSSADLLGGGGDGGCDPPGRGDREKSTEAEGVCGRLGILNCRGEPPGVVGAAIESGLRNGDWSFNAKLEIRPLGGDWGGWTMTAGGGALC
jgi:hypothetical protein